jgi:hypothetical protein
MIDSLKKKLKSLALADAILSPEWDYRYFSYDSKWGEQEEMASMRDGSGGHWFVLFQGERVGYKFISPNDGMMNDLAEIIENAPANYRKFLEEPAFYADQATGIWLLENEEWIKYGLQQAKFIEDLTTVTEWGCEGYKIWAEDYYERDLEHEALSKIFEHDLSSTVVEKLNPDLTLEDLDKDLKEIGIR